MQFLEQRENELVADREGVCKCHGSNRQSVLVRQPASGLGQGRGTDTAAWQPRAAVCFPQGGKHQDGSQRFQQVDTVDSVAIKLEAGSHPNRRNRARPDSRVGF